MAQWLNFKWLDLKKIGVLRVLEIKVSQLHVVSTPNPIIGREGSKKPLSYTCQLHLIGFGLKAHISKRLSAPGHWQIDNQGLYIYIHKHILIGHLKLVTGGNSMNENVWSYLATIVDVFCGSQVLQNFSHQPRRSTFQKNGETRVPSPSF